MRSNSFYFMKITHITHDTSELAWRKMLASREWQVSNILRPLPHVQYLPPGTQYFFQFYFIMQPTNYERSLHFAIVTHLLHTTPPKWESRIGCITRWVLVQPLHHEPDAWVHWVQHHPRKQKKKTLIRIKTFLLRLLSSAQHSLNRWDFRAGFATLHGTEFNHHALNFFELPAAAGRTFYNNFFFFLISMAWYKSG